MDVTIWAEGSFDAMHQIDALAACAEPHGHHWTVRVGVSGELDPKTGWPRGSQSLQEAIVQWTSELHRQDLRLMLPGVITSPLGIAGAAIEALALRYPRISEAEVVCSDGTRGVIRRSQRQL